MTKTLKEATVELYDRYGHYGPEGQIVETTLRLRHDDALGYFVTTEFPDNRIIYEVQWGQPKQYAEEVFAMIAASRIPSFLR